MQFALSTRWNSRRHADGARLVDEILETGISHIELGYDLRRDQLEGILARTREGAVRVVSLHNYCPVPVGVSRGHPEIWTFADPDPAVRRQAVEQTARTARLAAEFGAPAVIVHAGYVRMRPLSPRLLRLFERGRLDSWRGRRLATALDRRRERIAPRHLDWICECLERIAPTLDDCGVFLAFENLPSWEAVPAERELPALVERFGPERVRYWHDLGHGEIRHRLGWISHERLLERLSGWLAGLHVHDVAPPLRDHALPGEGDIDFSRFAPWARRPIPRVLEPERGVPAASLRAAQDRLREAWKPEARTPAAERRGSLYDPMPARGSGPAAPGRGPDG